MPTINDILVIDETQALIHLLISDPKIVLLAVWKILFYTTNKKHRDAHHTLH